MNVLMVGLSGTGKTTFLAQLYGRMRAGEGSLRLREAPGDISSIRDAYDRLAKGLAVEHTTSAASALPLALPAETPDGGTVDISMPDYAGESLDRLIAVRRSFDGWADLLKSARAWLLFVRLERFPELPELLSKSAGELIEERRHGSRAQSSAAARWASPSDLPLDMKLVELLQVLLHERVGRPRSNGNMPSLTVLLSCWDELDAPESEPPAEQARARIPLLYHYVTSTWPMSNLRFLGVSAQGQQLSSDRADSDYAEETPVAHGYLVDVDGSRTSDLSVAVPAT